MRESPASVHAKQHATQHILTVLPWRHYILCPRTPLCFFGEHARRSVGALRVRFRSRFLHCFGGSQGWLSIVRANAKTGSGIEAQIRGPATVTTGEARRLSDI